MAGSVFAAEIVPGEPVDYAPLAFQPKTWAEKKQDTHLVPWEGREIVFLTLPGDYDRALLFRQLHGKATIAAVNSAVTGSALCSPQCEP